MSLSRYLHQLHNALFFGDFLYRGLFLSRRLLGRRFLCRRLFAPVDITHVIHQYGGQQITKEAAAVAVVIVAAVVIRAAQQRTKQAAAVIVAIAVIAGIALFILRRVFKLYLKPCNEFLYGNGSIWYEGYGPKGKLDEIEEENKYNT